MNEPKYGKLRVEETERLLFSLERFMDWENGNGCVISDFFSGLSFYGNET